MEALGDGLLVFHRKRLEPRVLPWQQYSRRHFVSFVMCISGAKFEDHCFKSSLHTIRKEQGIQFLVLWSIFTYIITHHGLGGFSGLINGLIAAAISDLSMLTSEPTAKNNVKRTHNFMFVLSLSQHYITLHVLDLEAKLGSRNSPYY